ncbi:MAG: PQQ-binding-like beta-propeller repeat protein [Hyphomicrobium sp.]
MAAATASALAVDGGRLYAATGYGNVVAVDPQNGKVLWEKQLEAPVRSSPTAVGDKVYVLSLDGRFFCFAGADAASCGRCAARRSRRA